MAYLPLSTANLPDPAIDPAQGSSPQDYFNTVLYTGNGSSQSLSVGFQPDFVWGKGRSYSVNHALIDAVRGSDKYLESSTTDAEDTLSTIITSFDSDGFSVGSAGRLNGSGNTYVAWNWKANGSGVSNTDGSITSTVSANTESGFSVVSYTGTAANATVGHGLDSAPEMFMLKNRSATGDWYVYHSALGATKNLRLNLDSSAFTTSNLFNDTEPTSTTFSLGFSAGSNGSGSNYIAYCFHSVEGFSKIGSYTGNGSADGPFVYTGFRPAFVMAKPASPSGDNWLIQDSTRDTFNDSANRLFPNLNIAEIDDSPTYSMDFVSNGFKVRSSHTSINNSGNTFIYMAFAENPFKYSNAR